MDTKRFFAAAACAAFAGLVVGTNAGAEDTLPLPIALPTPTLPSTPVLQSGDTSSAASSGAGQTPQSESRATSVAVAAQRGAQIVAEINRVRRAHKLRPLRMSAQLTRAGVEHAKALALTGQFTHAWPDGAPFSAWIKRYYTSARYRAWSTGENLVWREPDLSARAAVQMWLASPPHRRNLLSRSWREIGLGVVDAEAAPGAYGGSNIELAAAEFGRRSR